MLLNKNLPADPLSYDHSDKRMNGLNVFDTRKSKAAGDALTI